MLPEKEALCKEDPLDCDSMDVDNPPLVQDINAMDVDPSLDADATDARSLETQICFAFAVRQSPPTARTYVDPTLSIPLLITFYSHSIFTTQ